MKRNKSIFIAFGLLVIVASLYRVWDGRPWGFAPQIAMAVFGGAVIKDKKWAFILPLLSMFLSDLLYEFLYVNNLSDMKGFYEGQLTNYALFTLMTCFGFFIKRINWLNVLAASLVAPTVFFILSNFFVWLAGAGFNRPKTFDGLLLCYNDALIFYRGSLMASVLFSAVLFGGYYAVKKYVVDKPKQLV